jgi:hypothetical protein
LLVARLNGCDSRGPLFHQTSNKLLVPAERAASPENLLAKHC